MIADRDLLAFRQSYYELFVSLFWKEPSGQLLLSLSDGIKERIRAARNLNALLSEGWDDMSRFLAETPAEQVSEVVADEYTLLFIGPRGPEVNPYESFYLTGRLLDRPLANVRTLLKAVGIEKQEGYAEPEDFLAFELEVMRWLIGKQLGAADPEEEKRWLRLQSDFLRDHLLVWAPNCADDISGAKSARFYRGVAMILRGFLELEHNLFRGLGLEKVTSLEEARKQHGAIPSWKGPTFDAAGKEPKVPSPAREK